MGTLKGLYPKRWFSPTSESFLDCLEDQESLERKDSGPFGKDAPAVRLAYPSGLGHDCVQGRGSLFFFFCNQA